MEKIIRESTEHDQIALDHIGIAVPDLEGEAARYCSLLGYVRGVAESLPEHGVEVLFLTNNANTVELLAPRGSGAIAKFLAKRGPGLHHLAYRVADIESQLKLYQKAGYRLIDQKPRPGARGHLVAFVHPLSFGGVLIELCQHQKQ